MHTDSLYISVSFKVYHYVNDDGPFDGRNGSETYFPHQKFRHHLHNDKL